MTRSTSMPSTVIERDVPRRHACPLPGTFAHGVLARQARLPHRALGLPERHKASAQDKPPIIDRSRRGRPRYNALVVSCASCHP